MSTAEKTADLECVSDPRRASALLHPLRGEILRFAREPTSATEIASRVGLARQKVNYHVRELARNGFLRRAGQRRKRNMVEQRYVATARAYVLDPTLLGDLSPRSENVSDRLSGTHLQARLAQSQAELSRASTEAARQGKRLATLTIESEIRFESARQREEFTRALRASLTEVIAKHTAPAIATGESAPRGRPFRLVVGCHPIPPPPKPRSTTRKENRP